MGTLTVRKEDSWSIQTALDYAKYIDPPQSSFKNVDLSDVNVHGHMAVVGKGGRLYVVNVFSSQASAIDIICDPPLTDQMMENIESISFNAVGDRLLLVGPRLLYVVDLPFDQRTLQMRPEPAQAK